MAAKDKERFERQTKEVKDKGYFIDWEGATQVSKGKQELDKIKKEHEKSTVEKVEEPVHEEKKQRKKSKRKKKKVNYVETSDSEYSSFD